jgi:hypothetical protein
MLAMQVFVFAGLAHSQAAPPDSQRQGLGSFTTNGEVYVNDSRAPSELTLFGGDSVRTSSIGTALLTTSASSSYQISPSSEVAFAGDPRYTAELKSGGISVKSSSGAGRAVVRAKDFVIVPTILNSQTVYKIEGAGDGSFVITCIVGNIGIVPIQGTPGLFLEAGQSATINAKNELIAAQPPGANPSAASQSGASSRGSSAPASQSAARNYRPFIYLGLAGGAAAVAAVAVTHTGRPVMSPSAP